MKSWIQTYTGKQFWPLDPKEEDIDIIDIAHALSMKCRYGGHSKTFYSVAEHSIFVSSYCPNKYKLEGLLHDATEGYLPDVVRPLKQHLTGFKQIEDNMARIIAKCFNLIYPFPEEVKRIDTAILGDEKRFLMADEPADWLLQEKPLGIAKFHFFPPKKGNVKQIFLDLFKVLFEDRWKTKYIQRLMDKAEMSHETATECFDGGLTDIDWESDPNDAADEELSYWGN